jgi:RNA polymerase sigma factor (TIGR02999 family)
MLAASHGSGYFRCVSEVTQILNAIEQGDPKAGGQLLPLVYAELRKLAAQKMAQENPGHTLQATALVHEAYMRLVESAPGKSWNGRGHFFAAAAEAMRRILVEGARGKGRQKRGGDRHRIDIQFSEPAAAEADADIVAVDEALTQLAVKHPQKAELVKLRYFAGMTLAEAATSLGISTATADRQWRYARAWLARQLRPHEA